MLISLKVWKPIKPKNVVFVILLLQLCISFGQRKVIVIDPGHGGKDTGAIGINGLQEKDVVLNVAKEIIKLNKTILNSEFDIYLTRYKDTLISLTDRTALTKNLKADIFISLHCNAAKLDVRGMEVFIHTSAKINNKASIELAMSILDEATSKLRIESRGIKLANFQVLRESYKPSTILIEIGFITNTDEADYYLKTRNIKAISLVILMGIHNYLNITL